VERGQNVEEGEGAGATKEGPDVVEERTSQEKWVVLQTGKTWEKNPQAYAPSGIRKG